MLSIRFRASAFAAAFLIANSSSLVGQQSTPPDTARRDTSAKLAPVSIVATPADRAEPTSAVHVDATTIQQTPAANPYELLRQTAGVEVHQQGQGPGFASDASLRGFSSDHATDLALWVDGVPINEPVNGHAEGYDDWSVLFPGGIQDIDVIRGPTSPLFGNFALGGVINVRTLERMNGSEATLTGGSYGRVDAMALTGFDHGDDGGVVGARFVHDDGFRPNAGSDIEQGHARLVHDLAPGVTLDGGAELYGSNWDSPGFLSEDEFARHEYDIVSNPTDGGFKRRAQERLSLRVVHGNLFWRTTTYATQGRWQLFLTIPPAGGRLEGSGSQTEEEDNRHGYGATSALTWGFARGELTLGGETRWDQAHYENYFTTARLRDSVNEVTTGRQLSGALFLQSHVDLTDRLRLDLGARYDALDTRDAPVDDAVSSATHGVLSPKVGAIYKLTDLFSTFANASRGFRSPDGIIEDPTLAPITEWAYEGGLKVDRGGATASAALFRMDVSNEETLNPVTLAATNGGSSRRQGLELDWHAPVAPTATVSGDWTFLDARYRSLTSVPEEGDEVPITLDGLRVYNTAKYVGDAALDVAPRGARWSVRLSGNWVGPYSPFDEPGVVLGAYGLAHASGTVRVAGNDLVLGVRNIFDRAFPELVAGGIVAPGEPRTVFVTVRRAF